VLGKVIFYFEAGTFTSVLTGVYYFAVSTCSGSTSYDSSEIPAILDGRLPLGIGICQAGLLVVGGTKRCPYGNRPYVPSYCFNMRHFKFAQERQFSPLQVARRGL
jgi:hypothetical protein